MLSLFFAVVGAVLSSVMMELRFPLQTSAGEWVWALRAVHLVSFFILALLLSALMVSYI